MNTLETSRRPRPLIAIALALTAACTGCSQPTMRVDGEVAATTNGVIRIEGPLRIEGPIKLDVQIAGPSNTYEGTYISQALLDRVIIGGTRQDWLLAVFGEPTNRASLDDSSEIWRWTYRPLEAQAALLSIFGGAATDAPIPEPSTTFIRLDQGLVIEKWRG